jgi:hypothetical protein
MAVPVAAIIAGVGGAMQLYQAYQARQRENEAIAEANRLGGIPIPKLAPTPQLLEQYRGATSQVANPQGYTPAQRGRFETRLANILATQKYNANQIGGGSTARAISALGNAGATAAEGDFAANDAALTMSNRNAGLNRLMTISNRIQSLDDTNKQIELERRQQAEVAAGRAIQTNRDLWQQSLTNVGSDLVGAGLTKMLAPKALPTTAPMAQPPTTTTTSQAPILMDTTTGNGEMVTPNPIKDPVLNMRFDPRTSSYFYPLKEEIVEPKPAYMTAPRSVRARKY